MRAGHCRGWALVIALVAAASCAQGTTIVVTPENMESFGWSIEVNSGGRTPVTAVGALTTWGPCVYEHHGFQSEDGVGFGRGAFFAECGYGGMLGTGDKTPDTVWLGLDQFNSQPLAGITLNRIRTMVYYSYVSKTPCYSDSTGWSSYTWWRGPNQPITVQITCVSADGGDYKQFWYRPWGGGVQGWDGGMSANWEGCWQHLDAYNGRWYHAPEWGDLSDEAEWPSWTDLCGTYGDYRVIATSTLPWGGGGLMSPGFDGQTVPRGYFYTTGTGKGLNFEVGARATSAYVYYSDDPGTPKIEKRMNWWNEAAGLRGHMDFFTLGIDLNGDGDDTDPGELVTYNFEPSPSDPDPVIVASSMKALNNNPLVGTDQDNSSYATNFARTRFMHKVFGKVMWRTGQAIGAALEDGSNIRQFYQGEPPEPYFESVRYYFPLDYGLPAGTWMGSYWSGWGLVERLRGFNYTEQPPLMLWTDPGHMKKF